MGRVRMCRFCTNMVCGDANWCEVFQECYSDERIAEENDCNGFEFNPIDAITLTECYPHVVHEMRRNAKETALYQRRMAGDWS